MGETPDSVAHSERVLGWIGPVMAPVALSFAALQTLHYGSPISGLVLTATAVALAGTRWAPRLHVSRMAWVAFHALFGMTVVSYLRGGVIWGILAFTPAPAVMATLFGRTKEMVGSALAVPLVVLSLYVLERAGMTPPRVESSLEGVLAGAFGALLSLIVIVLLQERLRARMEADRERMRARLFEASKAEGVARLAGGVAHDFNNLLSVVSSHARVVRGELGPDHPAHEDLRAIERAAAAGAGLTRRLLAVGRERPPEPRAIDLPKFVSEVCKLMGRVMPESVVIAQKHEAGVVIEGDPWQLHQVVMNLLLNARDAMPDGGLLSVRVRSHRQSEEGLLRFGTLAPGDYAVLEVSDAGVGMSDELVEGYVEPFFTSKGESGGSGLGGSVVHGVALALGGGLDLKTAPGKGTTIRVFLPRSDAAPAEVDEPSYTEPPVPLTILFVEDDDAVRKATQRLLRMDGHDVLAARGGARALELLREHHVDVVLTDVSMPGMSGPELVRQAREERPGLAVVFFSGFPGSAVGPGDLLGERVAFLQKPASRTALRLALDSVRAA